MAITYTPNYNLAKPDRGTIEWDDEINGNFDALDQIIKDLETIILSHTNNTNNPHQVTYAQVGAAPASHTHSGDQITGAVPEAESLEGYRAQDFVLKQPYHCRVTDKTHNKYPSPGVLIPLYVYPSDVFSNSTYNTLISLATTYSDIPFIVILNPNSGPGNVQDGNYTKAIDRLTGAGIEVCGYVNTDYAQRAFDDVVQDIEKWIELYPTIKGFFFDEVSTDSNTNQYYQNLYVYTKNRGPFMVIGNPGTTVLRTLADLFDITVIWENNTFPDETQLQYLKGDYDNGLIEVPNSKKAILIHNEAREYMLTYYVATLLTYCGWLYVNRFGWDTLSPYLSKMLRNMATVKQIPHLPQTVITLTYNTNGNLQSITEEDGLDVIKGATLHYKADGSLDYIEESIGNVTFHVYFNYDSNGNLQTIQRVRVW